MKRKIAVVLALCLLITVSFTNLNSFATGGSWKSDSSGWWYEYSDGSYAMGWTEIDGYWYYFLGSGYMDYSEYRDGCWLNADGTWNTAYSGGYWASDSTGWWYTDASGWYPVNTWLWIDGSCYFFKASGYMAVNETIDGYYVDASGKKSASSGSTSNGAHTHTWVCTKEAWDEKVPKYETVYGVVYTCMGCGRELGIDFCPSGPCPSCGSLECAGYTYSKQEIVGYDTVHHDAEYQCSTCGATK